jgi:hypothetical protein
MCTVLVLVVLVPVLEIDLWYHSDVPVPVPAYLSTLPVCTVEPYRTVVR